MIQQTIGSQICTAQKNTLVLVSFQSVSFLLLCIDSHDEVDYRFKRYLCQPQHRVAFQLIM